jgi:uncharacterized protein (TIGR02147 family)
MASVFEYTDFRKFLADLIADKKAGDSSFTYRHLASMAGFKSAGFFTQVLQGKTNLSDQMILKLGLAFGLSSREAQYFGCMVRYNQADSHDNKKAFFQKMVAFKKARVKTIDPESYDFYDKWYYSAIRAVLQYYSFDGADYTGLARAVVPAIKVSEARRAISVLCSLGLIAQDSTSRYILTDKHITTGLNTDSVVVNNFVINTLEIAKDALYRFPKESRSLSSLTLGISKDGYDKIKQRCDEFRKELVEIVRNDSNVDRVYQVNMQVFPLTPLTMGEGV